MVQFHCLSLPWQQSELLRTWSQVHRHVESAKAWGIGHSESCWISLTLRFATFGSRHETFTLAYTLVVTEAGLLLSEDNRSLRSLDQSLSWACFLGMTSQANSPERRRAFRILSEFIELEDGSIVPPPAMAPTSESKETQASV